MWAPPHTSPEPEPEPEPVPVSPAINETDPPISNDVGAPGGQCGECINCRSFQVAYILLSRLCGYENNRILLSFSCGWN